MDGERSYPGLPSLLPNADPPGTVVIRQTRLIIPFPSGDPRVAIAEMATPDVEFGDAYHDLLLYSGVSALMRSGPPGLGPGGAGAVGSVNTIAEERE